MDVTLAAEHYDGTTQYNTHNLYGVTMAKAHYEAYTAATGRRPFNVIRFVLWFVSENLTEAMLTALFTVLASEGWCLNNFAVI